MRKAAMNWSGAKREVVEVVCASPCERTMLNSYPARARTVLAAALNPRVQCRAAVNFAVHRTSS